MISFNGLSASANPEKWVWVNFFAKKGFPISGQLARADNFPGTIVYYFEVTIMSSSHRVMLVGLSSETIPNGSYVGDLPNSYAIQEGCDHCWLSDMPHQFEWPHGAIKPKWNGTGDVNGCGLLLNSENALSIFFTINGILMGKQISINPTANLLYPSVWVFGIVSIEANFGDDSAKPFRYDIDKCPGMNLE